MTKRTIHIITPERREGEQAPEAEATGPYPPDGQTAATLLAIPDFLKRSNWIDGKPPGVAA